MDWQSDGPGAALFTVNATPRSAGAGDSPAPRVALELSPAVPNPFQDRARIDYLLPAAEFVKLTVHDVQGRRVTTLRDGELQAGWHSSTWDGRAETGGEARAGVYFLRLETRGEAGAQVKLRTIVLSR